MRSLGRSSLMFGILLVAIASTTAIGASAAGTTVSDGLAARNSNPTVLPPGAMPYGKSYADWGVEWWRWALSFPWASNPINDPTGAFGQQDQNTLVWFLAGSAGGTTVRTATIPAGRAVFFPIINFDVTYPCPDPTFEPAPGQTLEEFLQSVGDWAMAAVTSISAEVDGVPVQNPFQYRAQSGLATITANPDLTANFDACITGSSQYFVSDGYWVMLAPLSAGSHTIHFAADVPSFGFSLDVAYNIRVSGGIHDPVDVDRMDRTGSEAASPKTSWGRIKAIYR